MSFFASWRRGLQERSRRSGRNGSDASFDAVIENVRKDREGTVPVVLDMFSGSGMIPLEAARVGAAAIGIDLSPVATLAGRILADFPARDWSSEPKLKLESPPGSQSKITTGGTSRIVEDVEMFLAEVGRRTLERVKDYYPLNERNKLPWAYLWATTVPCDACKVPFPLMGSFALRHPDTSKNFKGQSLEFTVSSKTWSVAVVEGAPTQQPTYASGTGRRQTEKGEDRSMPAVSAHAFAGLH